MTDPRGSRIPKIESIPAQHLTYIAREWLFDCDNWNTSTFHFLTVVKSGACRENDECAWLLDKFGGITSRLDRKWMLNRISNDDSPRSKYYRARLSDDNELMRESAQAGFPAAMACYDEFMDEAVKLLDPWALYYCGYYYHGAQIGSTRCMRKLNAQSAKFYAKCILYTAHAHIPEPEGFVEEDRFIIGQELEGYNQFWDSNRVIGLTYLNGCIELYLTHLHYARRAALQTVVALRTLLGRDVAQIIGKLVYATRGELLADTRIDKKIKL